MAGRGARRPVLFAYDGSELAAHAIDEAARLLDTALPALVATIWQPFDLGFTPVQPGQFDAADIGSVRDAAEQTARAGADRARAGGFEAEAIAVEAAPTWKGLADLAEQRDASAIVLGSHGRTGLASILLGSVAASTAAHSRRSVLIIHRDS